LEEEGGGEAGGNEGGAADALAVAMTQLEKVPVTNRQADVAENKRNERIRVRELMGPPKVPSSFAPVRRKGSGKSIGRQVAGGAAFGGSGCQSRFRKIACAGVDEAWFSAIFRGGRWIRGGFLQAASVRSHIEEER
jgi:hypothetical protein